LLENPTSPISIVPRAEIETRFDGYALVAQTGNNHKVPNIHFNETDFDFGILGVGQKVEHNYRFQNTGQKDLTVSVTDVSCGCTGALLTKGNEDTKELTLKPGEAASIRVSYTVQTVGPSQQMVTLKTNDPLRPLIYLTIRGTAPQDLRVSPATLFMRGDKGTAVQAYLQITAPPTMEVTQATVGNDSFQVAYTLTSADENKKVWRVQLERKANAPVGETKPTLTVKTTHAERPVITVPITSIVEGDLQLSPAAAFFGFVNKNEGAKPITLTVQSRAQKPFRITGVKTGGNEQALRITGLTDSAAVSHSITLELDPAQAQFLDSSLTIKTDVAGEENLQVPVTALVEDADATDIQATPRQLSLGEMENGRSLKKHIIIESRSGQEFSIRSVQSQNPQIVGKASPNVTASKHAVEIDVTAKGETGAILRDAVKLTLSNGRVLEVPVFGMIVKADPEKVGQAPLVQVGKPAPDFTLTDANGNPHKLSDLKGKKNLLLTFFPKCFTGGCAGHLASLQRELPNFTQSDTEVWAVSVDPAEEQAAFAAKLGLQFPLLSDTDRKLSMLYGAAQDKTDLAARQSVLVDKTGVVRWIDRDVQVETHGADVLAKMRELGIGKYSAPFASADEQLSHKIKPRYMVFLRQKF
jgi:peroxiredoxin